MTSPKAICEHVASGCSVLARNGHGDYIWGHLAVRDPDGRGVWMKAAGLGFDETSSTDVVLVGFDGEVLEGTGQRHVEWPIHTEVMLRRPDVHATVHSHPPHAIALGAAGRPLLPVSHAATIFVPPDVPRYQKTSNLIVSRDLGSSVAESLQELHALILVNHGIVTAGVDVHSAVIRAIMLENACHQQMLVNGLGGAAFVTDPDEALAKRETIWSSKAFASLWEHLLRTR